MSAQKGHLALNESTLRAEKGSMHVHGLYMWHNSPQPPQPPPPTQGSPIQTPPPVALIIQGTISAHTALHKIALGPLYSS